MDGWTALLLVLQMLLAIAGVVVFRKRVRPAVFDESDAALTVDVWGPLAVAAPLLVHIKDVGAVVRDGGWVPLGAPVVVGVAGIGFAMMGPVVRAARSGGAAQESRPPLGTATIWGGVGLVLLLLAGAYDMAVGVGQCAFALAAVLLWSNTPHPSPSPSRPSSSPGGISLVMALTLTVFCALGQATAAFFVPAGTAGVFSISIALGYALAILCTGGMPPPLSMRLSGWTAALGVLLGLGLLSLQRLIPVLLVVLDRGSLDVAPLRRVAYGFGVLAPEAVLLLGICVVIVVVPRRWRGPVGAVAMLLAGVLLVTRYAGILHDAQG